MKSWRRILIVLSGILAVMLAAMFSIPRAAQAVTATLVQVVNTAAGPVFTRDAATLPSKEVTLQVILTNPVQFGRIFPNGTAGSTPFTIPSGQAFVLTDYSWTVTNAVPNGTYTIVLVNQNNFGVDTQGGVADSSGTAFGSAHLNTGIAFTTNGNTHFLGVDLATQSPSLVLHEMTLHGYLAPNQ